MALDFSTSDITAIFAVAVSVIAFIWQRSQVRTEAKRVAESARVEAVRLAENAKTEAVRLAEKVKTEAVRLAEKVIAQRDEMMGEVRERIVAIETKQDVIWDFLIRRSKAELVTRKWGTIKSPLVLTVDAVECMKHLLPQLLPFYDLVMAKVPEADERALFIEFERTFGDMLVTEVCIPFNMTSGACVLAAIELCRSNTTHAKHLDMMKTPEIDTDPVRTMRRGFDMRENSPSGMVNPLQPGLDDTSKK